MVKGKDLIMIDIETSDIHYDSDIIYYTATVIPFNGKSYSISKYGKPKKELDEATSKFIKITNDDLKDAIDSESLKEEIKELIKDKIVITQSKECLENFLEEELEDCVDSYEFNEIEFNRPKYKELIDELREKFKDNKDIKTSDVQAYLNCDWKTAYILSSIVIN